ncbi:MAG TPA: hypothetical protein VGG34_09995 [Opitutaceae bacterium]
MSLSLKKLLQACALIGAAVGASAPAMRAYGNNGLATDINGLYYTGLTSTGALQSAGGQDANWNVTYASTDAGTNESTSNEGAAYVISASNVSGSAYTPNTGSAQWITAPGAYTTTSTSSTQNAGGDYLPGNGNSGGNEGVYIYTLAFTITGTGSGTVTNDVQITMTLAADDQYAVYVNPGGSGNSIPTGTASATLTSAWSNKSQITLQNYTGNGGTNNASFKIGINYLVIVVDNTNSVTGTSSSTALNASGLLVYQTAAAEINGQPIPEMSTWLAVLGSLGAYGLILLRRRQEKPRPVRA